MSQELQTERKALAPSDTLAGEPLRVLHVLGAMDRGGAELRLLDVMRCIDPAEIRLEFCALSGRRGTLAEEIRALGGMVHPCKLGLLFPVRFAALLRRRRVDIVHSHVHLATGFILALARLAGLRRRIAHFRSTGDEHGASLPRTAYRAVMHWLLDAAATDILAVSEGAMTEGWSRAWRSDPRCQVIYNGVDARRFDQPDARASVCRELGLAREIPIIVQVGRFDPPKNQLRTVEIMSAVAARSPAHLLFVGRGGTPEEAAVRRRIGELGLAGRFHFLGQREDVPRLLCAADVSLLPSTHEGLPGVVLESLAAGTEVVASDLPGVREIAGRLPGVRIRSPGDSSATWADEIVALLDEPRPRDHRSQARSRFLASRFAIESATAAMVGVWTGGRR